VSNPGRETCGTCRFHRNGCCLRYPPTLVVTGPATLEGDGMFSDWPDVEPDDWCGEHRAVAPAPNEETA
jgi:hypothetical protein